MLKRISYEKKHETNDGFNDIADIKKRVGFCKERMDTISSKFSTKLQEVMILYCWVYKYMTPFYFVYLFTYCMTLKHKCTNRIYLRVASSNPDLGILILAFTASIAFGLPALLQHYSTVVFCYNFIFHM